MVAFTAVKPSTFRTLAQRVDKIFRLVIDEVETTRFVMFAFVEVELVIVELVVDTPAIFKLVMFAVVIVVDAIVEVAKVDVPFT